MIHLLKKELSELLSKQMLIGLAVSFLVIMSLGILMTTSLTGEFENSGTVRIIDNDQTTFTRQLKDRLEEYGYTVETGSRFEEMAEQKGWTDAVLLPEGMTEALLERHEAVELSTYSYLKSTSTMSLALTDSGSAGIVKNTIRNLLAEEYLTGDLAFLEDPISLRSNTYANGRTVEADPAAVISSVALFDQLMPLVLFLLVILTAQTIIGAIAAEKTDKTLETLLSSPVPRSQIIGAKMLAALIVALIYAGVYGIGFFTSMLTTVGGSMENVDLGDALTNMASTRQAVMALGLDIPAWGWAGVIVQLLLTLAISLTASIILGGLVEDAKGSQTASMPILLCTMFPYILTMVSDIRSMELPVRMLLYAIPFTHTFIATGCLRFNDLSTFWGGMAYQIVFLAVLGFAALRLYSSDMLFVHSGARRRAKQKSEE